MSLFSAILKSRKPQNWCITSFLYFMCPKNVICCENSMFCGFYHTKILKNTLSDQAKLCTLCNTPKIIFHVSTFLLSGTLLIVDVPDRQLNVHFGTWKFWRYPSQQLGTVSPIIIEICSMCLVAVDCDNWMSVSKNIHCILHNKKMKCIKGHQECVLCVLCVCMCVGVCMCVVLCVLCVFVHVVCCVLYVVCVLLCAPAYFHMASRVATHYCVSNMLVYNLTYTTTHTAHTCNKTHTHTIPMPMPVCVKNSMSLKSASCQTLPRIDCL